MKPKNPKVVILGLDGLSWSLIQKMIAQGIMPRLEALIQASTAGPMLSTLPEISPVAWTTFFTARPPCEHGIYGFTEFETNDYRVRFNSSVDVQVPFVWDWLGLRACRSVVLNVPLTYPARPLSGVMVSGFVALEYERAAYPAWVADFLRRSQYRLEADFEKVHQERAAFLDDLDAALNGRTMLFDRFWPDDWDLFVLVVTDTDRLFHFFLGEFMNDGPIREYFYNFMRRVDELVGRVWDQATKLADAHEDLTLVMLSDHGFTPVKQEFHLNRWLAAQGFLTRPGPEALALALDPTRIYFNRPARFIGGRLGSADCERLAREITAGLMQEPAVAGVTPGPEIYTGAQASLAPDLVVHPEKGYEFKAKFTPGSIYTDSLLTGTHTHDDAFFLIHDLHDRKVPLEIMDILNLGEFVFSRFGI